MSPSALIGQSALHSGPRSLRLSVALVVLIVAADAMLIGIGYLGFVATSARPLLLAIVLLLYMYRRYATREPRIAQIVLYAMLFALATNALATLSYLVTSLGAAIPPIDSSLADVDRSMGFDWPAMHDWLLAHPILASAAQIFYSGAALQVVGMIVLLGHQRHAERAATFFAAFVVTGLLTILLGASMPALSAFVQFHTPEAATTAFVKQLMALRSGQLNTVNLRSAEGLVQFPSFHAALALLCSNAVRGLRGWSPTVALVNVLTVAATPFCGGHYAVDVFAGLLLAFVVIAVLGRLDRRA